MLVALLTHLCRLRRGLDPFDLHLHRLSLGEELLRCFDVRLWVENFPSFGYIPKLVPKLVPNLQDPATPHNHDQVAKILEPAPAFSRSCPWSLSCVLLPSSERHFTSM